MHREKNAILETLAARLDIPKTTLQALSVKDLITRLKARDLYDTSISLGRGNPSINPSQIFTYSDDSTRVTTYLSEGWGALQNSIKTINDAPNDVLKFHAIQEVSRRLDFVKVLSREITALHRPLILLLSKDSLEYRLYDVSNMVSSLKNAPKLLIIKAWQGDEEAMAGLGVENPTEEIKTWAHMIETMFHTELFEMIPKDATPNSKEGWTRLQDQLYGYLGPADAGIFQKKNPHKM